MRKGRPRIWQVTLLSGVALLFGLCFNAQAISKHMEKGVYVPMKNADGGLIYVGDTDAISLEQTCGNTSCHAGSGYDKIEEHSYHSQLGANEFKGWNNWNPDSADKFKSGPAPKGKNWTQSPGHVGKW